MKRKFSRAAAPPGMAGVAVAAGILSGTAPPAASENAGRIGCTSVRGHPHGRGTHSMLCFADGHAVPEDVQARVNEGIPCVESR